MRQTVRLLVFICASVASTVVAAADGEVLWWTVGENYRSITATAEDGSVTTAGDLGVTDVRVRYDSDDGASSGYLTFFGINEDESVSVYDGSAGLGAEYGMGLPAEYFGDLSGLSGTSYSFVIELGNYTDGRWTRTSMESERVSYGDLVSKNHIVEWKHDYPDYGSAWSPGNYSVVPEPSSGILVLIGGALLALRRRHGG